METGILIACRMKSTRLSRKALLPIVGKPLIDHLIERVKCAKKVDKVILCTSTHFEDAILEEVARRNNIYFFKGSEEDVMGRFIAAAEKFQLDVVVRVTGDNPLTDPWYIDKAIESHIVSKADFTKVEQLPLGTNCEVISISTLRKAHALAVDPNLSEYMTAYLKQPKYFKINVLEVEPFLKHPEIRLTVDVQQDLQLMEEIYGRLYVPDGRIFGLEEVVNLLVYKEPKLISINKNVPERLMPKILMKDDPVTNKPKVVIFGARMDGHAGAVLTVVEQYALYNVTGLIDNDISLHNTAIQGIPVLGGVEESYLKIPPDTEGFFVASGDNSFKEQCYKIMATKGLKPVNVIHPTAIIPRDIIIGKGVFIGPQVVITNNVIIGDGVIINAATTIDYNTIIGDFVNINPGCHISGRVQIKKGAFLETGVIVLPEKIVGEEVRVGAGMVVANDLLH